jgi:hypothetical protein
VPCPKRVIPRMMCEGTQSSLLLQFFRHTEGARLAPPAGLGAEGTRLKNRPLKIGRLDV